MSNINTSFLRKPATGEGGFDGTLSGVSEALFPAASQGSFQERFVYNPNAAGTLWINVVGGVAVANGADCVAIPPLTGTSWYHTNAVTIIGAGNLTFGER